MVEIPAPPRGLFTKKHMRWVAAQRKSKAGAPRIRNIDEVNAAAKGDPRLAKAIRAINKEFGGGANQTSANT